MPAKQATSTAKPTAAKGAKAAPKAASKAAPKKEAVPKKAATKAAPKKEVVPKKEAPKKAVGVPKKDAAKKPAAKTAAKTAKKVPGPTKTVQKGVTTAGKSGKDKKPATKRALRVVKAKKLKVRPNKFFIDCSAPVEDGIMDPASFEKFLHDTFKISTGPLAKPGVLGDKVVIGREKAKISISLNDLKLRKSYLKYLTKKYLKKQQLRDWLRVIANQPNSLELRYYNIQDNDDDSGSESDGEDQS